MDRLRAKVVERAAPRDVDDEALGDAEVENLHDAVVADHDVLGLHVPVHQAPVVGGAERASRIDHPPQLRLPGDLRVADEGAQALADHQLHRDEQLPIGLAHVEHRDGVGVVERRGGPRLAHDASLRVGRHVGVGGPLDLEHLERDAAVQARVVRLVDAGHAPLPEEILDDIAVEAVACREGH